MDIQKLRYAVKDFRFQGKMPFPNDTPLTVRDNNKLVECIARALDKFVDELEEDAEKAKNPNHQ